MVVMTVVFSEMRRANKQDGSIGRNLYFFWFMQFIIS